MSAQGLGSAAPKSTTPVASGTTAARQHNPKKGNAVGTAREKEATAHVPRITRTTSKREVAPVPDNARVLRPAASSTPLATTPTPSPHRPRPQVTYRDLSGDLSAVSAFSDEPTTSNEKSGNKRGKKNRKPDTAKRSEFERLRVKILDEDETSSLDDLATVFAEVVTLMKGYKTSAPIAANWEALDAITERLVNHHAFPRAGDDKEAFGAIVTRSVSVPVKELSTRLESQNKAIISLTKSVESLKKAAILTDQSVSSASPTSAKSFARVASAKPVPPIPNPSDERILVRFDGEVPPIFRLEYHVILKELNAHLASLDLPGLVYTQKQSATSIFIVPKTKEDLELLTRQWNVWAPKVLPGGRIAPVAEHCYLQVNGVPFKAVESLDSTAREFEERNPALGKVLSITWVNRPPSEAKVAAIAARGKKPPTAGSLFIRLQSRDSVDRAVAAGRVILAGMAPTVERGFPHLRICQCWGCLKYGHTRSRCGVKTERCGGCGKEAHGPICTEKPTCINCGEAHRSDSMACPARKRIAAQLKQRAADICRALDQASSYNKPRTASESSTTQAVSPAVNKTDSFALRLHERS
ncbi:hypothetical protein DFH06DRAFT_1421616 [Mycena polygramma]|nr:hypothetical protein DFH06DRAFT_1421616 [Mycena polygramma]